MSLTREEAKQQAKRLTACPALMPQSKEGMSEVVDCLMRHCHSQEHASLAMTEFLDKAIDSRNTTAELAAIARQTRQVESFPLGCHRCTLDPDVDTGEPRYLSHVSATRGGYDVAVRCGCPRGRALAAKDAQRIAEEKCR